jgi:hypothetical protein
VLLFLKRTRRRFSELIQYGNVLASLPQSIVEEINSAGLPFEFSHEQKHSSSRYLLWGNGNRRLRLHSLPKLLDFYIFGCLKGNLSDTEFRGTGSRLYVTAVKRLRNLRERHLAFSVLIGKQVLVLTVTSCNWAKHVSSIAFANYLKISNIRGKRYSPPARRKSMAPLVRYRGNFSCQVD